MDNNKELGRSIKNRLGDLKATPSDQVWSDIELRMRKNEDRRLVPIWLYGIVGLGLLFIGVFIGHQFHIDESAPSLDQQHEVINASEESSDAQHSLSFQESEQKETVEDRNSKNTTTNTSGEQKNLLLKSVPGRYAKRNKNKQKNGSEIYDNQDSQGNQVKTNAVSEQDASESLSQANAVSTLNSDKMESKAHQAEETEFKLLTNEENKEKVEKVIKDTEEHYQRSKEDSLKKKESRWSVSLYGSSHYYLNTTDENFISSNTDFEASNRWSLNYGLSFNYQLSKKWQLRVGANRVRLNQEYDVNSGLELGDLNRVNSSVSNDSFSEFNDRNDSYLIQQKIEYLQVLLHARYLISDSTYGWSLIGGMNYLGLDKNRVSAIASDEELFIGSNEELGSFTVSLSAGIGYKLPLFKDRLFFNGDLLFNYQIKPYPNLKDIRPLTISPQLGLEYKF